jgi:hypothetical protein
MRLIVQVEAVADELFQLDFGWAFGTAAIESAAVAAIPAVTTLAPVAAWAITAGTIAARS